MDLRTLLTTEGRINRATLLAHLSAYGAIFFSTYLVLFFLHDFAPRLILLTLGSLALATTIVICIPPLIRRAHDLDRSGWFALTIFLLNLQLFLSPSVPFVNKHGEAPSPNSRLTLVLATLYPVWPIASLWIVVLNITT